MQANGSLIKEINGSQPVREVVSYRGLFTAGWFGVREKYYSRLKIYDRLQASEQANCKLKKSSILSCTPAGRLMHACSTCVRDIRVAHSRSTCENSYCISLKNKIKVVVGACLVRGFKDLAFEFRSKRENQPLSCK